MTVEMIIEEDESLVGKVRKVITANAMVEVYARARDVDTDFQAGLGEPQIIGYLKSEDRMLLTGLKIKLAGRTVVQICEPIIGWIEADKITSQL